MIKWLNSYRQRWSSGWFTVLLLAGPMLFSPLAPADLDPEPDFAFTLYGGRLTDDNWRDSLRGEADWVDAYLLVGALSWTFYRPRHRWWSLELEGNLGRYAGDQDHWEFNGPIATARWHRFPWRDTLNTSLAFGLGLSYASEIPPVEVELDGSSEQLLLYWHIEASFGLPDREWEAIFRLHHRSTGYGLFGETGGGNAFTAGLRLRF